MAAMRPPYHTGTRLTEIVEILLSIAAIRFIIVSESFFVSYLVGSSNITNMPGEFRVKESCAPW